MLIKKLINIIDENIILDIGENSEVFFFFPGAPFFLFI
jgi:hypothetical protein